MSKTYNKHIHNTWVGVILQRKVNGGRENGTALSGEVRESHIVTESPQGGPGEMRDQADGFVREKHSGPESRGYKAGCVRGTLCKPG